MDEIINTLRRWYNRVRIFVLERFTTRVKRIKIEDKDGKEHDVVVEQNTEKVCEHKKIEEIAPTMWKCSECANAYFQINYKVLLTEHDLVKYLDQLATHLKLTLKDDEGV